jgi:hypothetical protein
VPAKALKDAFAYVICSLRHTVRQAVVIAIMTVGGVQPLSVPSSWDLITLIGTCASSGVAVQSQLLIGVICRVSSYLSNGPVRV